MLNFLSALSFLTIIPSPKKDLPWEDGRKILYFPLVGLLIGGMLCGADHVFSIFLGGEVRAVLDVLFLAVISGGLHLDGLADSADGLLSHRPEEKMLEIMRDERIGAMGTLALMFCISLKFAGIMGLEEDSRWIWLLTAPALARSAQVMGLVFMDYARKEGGIANNFFRKGEYRLLALIPLPALIPFFLGVTAGLVTLFSFILFAVFLMSFFRRKIGGMTGDTLGAMSEIVEAAIIIAGVA